MKFIYLLLLLILVPSQLILCMEENRRDSHTPQRLDILMELIKNRPGKVIRDEDFDQKGFSTERYFLIHRDREGTFSEFYFTREIDEDGVKYYGRVAYSDGDVNADRAWNRNNDVDPKYIEDKKDSGARVVKAVKQGQEAEIYFTALKNRYESEEQQENPMEFGQDVKKRNNGKNFPQRDPIKV